MARRLEFDYVAAVERATRTFWETGYTNTSIRDLLTSMGIGEGSFYNTLKNKKNAYIECLRHYNDTISMRRAMAFASAPTADSGARAMFQTILETLDDPDEPDVCLMATALSPEVLGDPDLAAYVQEQFHEWTEQMAQRFAADKARKLLPESFEPDVVASIIITYVQGLWRLAQVTPDRRKLADQIDGFLTAMGL